MVGAKRDSRLYEKRIGCYSSILISLFENFYYVLCGRVAFVRLNDKIENKILWDDVSIKTRKSVVMLLTRNRRMINDVAL